MPTYDYKCPSCGYIQEKFHSMSESPKIICPECSKKMVRQIGKGSGVIFKGSGFYETDYKEK